MSSLKLQHLFSPTAVSGSRRPIDTFAAVNGHHNTTVSGASSVAFDIPSVAGAALRVAFQGSPGAYSEFAAKISSPGCSTIPCRSLEAALDALNSGDADRAVLPVESTIGGTELRNYDIILRRNLAVVQELNLFVHYCLLAMPGVQPDELRRVISHPIALAHCSKSITKLGLHRQTEPVEDTAGAVEILRSRRLLDTAAIASPRAAEIYGLEVLVDGVQDISWNVTRFLVLSKTITSPLFNPNSRRKTSMVVAHRGGSMVMLLKVLSAFSRRNINLTKLEVINSSSEGKSPVMILDVRGKSELLRSFPHVIYVDFEGSPEDSATGEAIDEISNFSVFVRVLGCYAADTNVYDLK